ncbi:hypothetical protein B0H14DRAFT_2355022, partial [Mycena olivaceomarginata]
GALQTFAPKLAQYYATDLFNHIPGLQHNFTNSVFPSVTFNLGPQSVTFEHADELNRALGWCAITNEGDFDHTKSAYLYLKELKLVVESPSTATALIPSAVIHHGNTPLAPNQTRRSMTQYAASGLFRYVKCGFKTAKELLAHGGHTLKGVLNGVPRQRHDAGLDLFSKVDELAADRMACFGK